jgi:hypothetical protein
MNELKELQMALASIFCAHPLELDGNINPTKEQILVWRDKLMHENKTINDALQKGFNLLRSKRYDTTDETFPQERLNSDWSHYDRGWKHSEKENDA